ncbi:MAG: hypothetical protein AB1806_09310 [Acidobacteriota bacterium]
MKTRDVGFSLLILAAGLVGLLFTSCAVAAAQMHQGQVQTGQTAGHQHGTQTMQGAQATMMSTQQMMQNVDAMMKNATSNMQNLASMHQGMGGTQPNTQMFSAMQGLLGHMKQLQGSMNEWMKNPQAMHDEAGMKSFQEACGNLEQMTRSFEEMTKHMNEVMKGSGHGPKR